MDSNNRTTHNKSSKEKQAAAASILAFKFKREKKLKGDLRPHFKQLGKGVKKYYSTNGKLPSFEQHRDAVKSIINAHYIDTATLASTTIRDNFKPIPDDERLQSLIDANIEVDADDRSDFAADSISGTTKDNYKDAIKMSIAAAAVAGAVLSKENIADDISDDFEDTIEDRLDLISQMETGVAADDGKANEIDALDDTDAEFDDGTSLADYKTQKTWIAILDSQTRPWHRSADGQTVDYDQPYIVDGEELMEPRDDSLGASDENLMGCRCESIENWEWKMRKPI